MNASNRRRSLVAPSPEQLLVEATNYAEKIFQAVEQPLLVLDDSLVVISANRAFHRVFNRSGRKIAGRPLAYAAGSGMQARELRAQLLAVARGKASLRKCQMQLRKTRDGGSRLVLLNAQPLVRNRGAQWILLGLEDVARLEQTGREREQLLRKLRGMARQLEERVEARTNELQQVNSKLQTLSARLLEAQEMERRHLARELHDEIGQQITSLQILIERQVSLCPPALKRTFRETRRATVELLETVRQLSAELRPQLLDDFGLIAALEWHLKRFRKRTGIRVHLNTEHFRDDLLNSFLRNVLFRIAQEALTNVARHSGVNEAWVQFSTRKGLCRLKIIDKGKGFNVQAAVEKGAVGLTGMRERIFLAGGKLSIESMPKKQTTITIEVPLITPYTNALDPEHAPEPS